MNGFQPQMNAYTQQIPYNNLYFDNNLNRQQYQTTYDNNSQTRSNDFLGQTGQQTGQRIN
jgi:hypothetical protein